MSPSMAVLVGLLGVWFVGSGRLSAVMAVITGVTPAAPSSTPPVTGGGVPSTGQSGGGASSGGTGGSAAGFGGVVTP